MPNETDVLSAFTFTDKDGCSVTVKHYADGDVMFKQDDNLVFVPAELVAVLVLSLQQHGA